MKKLVLVCSISVLLSGCALVDVFKMSRWDNNEYALANQIHTDAQLGVEKCGTKDVLPYVDRIYVRSVELKNYSGSLPRNQESAKMTTELLAITKGLHDRYKEEEEVSQKYCELKFGTIEGSTEVIKKALGGKPR